MSAYEPWFRPRDGAELIFAGNPGTGTGNGIYAVSLSTGVVRTIVTPSVGIEIDRITVAPDGSRVAYSAATDGSDVNTYRVMVTGIDGSGTVTMPMPGGATFQDAAALVERRHQDRPRSWVRAAQRGDDAGRTPRRADRVALGRRPHEG